MPSDATSCSLDGTCREPALLGGKGAALDRLVSWSLPVPPAGVITTQAYERFVGVPELDELIDRIRRGEVVPAPAVDSAFLGVELEPTLVEQLTALARKVGGDRHVAVRSSATVEDMAEASFAGLYRSVLDVDPADGDAVLDAVRLVFASLWHPAACAYRRAVGVDDQEAAMAAVLMQMVPSVRAGVVFTVDPGGSAGAARVEAVDGPGESLVSGQATPDAWVTDRADPDCDLRAEVAEALRMALDVERRAAAPQDVEWAWDGVQVWLLQSRPITGAAERDGDGFDSHPGDDDLTTAGIGEMLPVVLPPLLWELNSHLVEQAFCRVLDDLDVLSEEIGDRELVQRVRGRAALDFSRLQSMAAALPGSAAEELEVQYFGSHRRGRAAVGPTHRGSRLASLRHDHRVLRARRRNAFEGETVIEAVVDLRGRPPDLGTYELTELLGYRLGLVDLAARTMAAELGAAADAAAAYRRVEVLLIPHLGGVEAGRWAEQLVSRSGVMAAAMPDASMALFGGPTWRERGREPPVFEPSPGGDVAGEELERTLAATPSWRSGTLRAAVRTRALRQTVAEAITLLRRREHVKQALLELGGEVRRVHLEIGRRLVEHGVLSEPDDVELLTTPELHAALSGDPVPPAAIGDRRRWRARYEAEPPLPARFRGRPVPAEVVLPAGGRLDGWAASPGRFAGRVQVVATADGPFEPGRVLVAEATDASWAPLFVDAGAIVLERGGPLSHAATLARELGVPAVLAVPGATRHLDGAEVTVDGDHGVVVVHDTESKMVDP